MGIERIVFHVGMPRTGTTALQAFLTQNEVPGIFYPNAFKDGEGYGHHELPRLFAHNPHDLRREFFRAAACARSNQQVMLLSTENFLNAIPSKADAYDKFFDALECSIDAQVEFICTLRSLDDFVWSMYLQTLRDMSAKFPGQYAVYYGFAVRQVSRNISHFAASRRKVHMMQFSRERLLQDFLSKLSPALAGMNRGKLPDNHSVAPTTLFHGLAYFTRKRQIQIDDKVWWRLVGADLSKQFFNEGTQYFEPCSVDAGELKSAVLGIGAPEFHELLMRPGKIETADFLRPRRGYTDLMVRPKFYLDYLIKSADAEGVTKEAASFAKDVVEEYCSMFR